MAYPSRKRLWCPEEDKTLTDWVEKHGPRNWNQLARLSGLQRDGNSCRLRWMNHLKPGVNRRNFTEEEDEIIIEAHRFYGNQWSIIASQLPGRTDNQIKNRWNSHLSKKEVVSEEDGIPNHSEIHQNISNELSAGHEFHSDGFHEPFPELESYQYPPHNPFLEDERFSPHQDFFPETFSELESYQYPPHNPFLEDERFSPHQDFFPETFSEHEYLPHEPFPENEFQLWDFSSTSS